MPDRSITTLQEVSIEEEGTALFGLVADTSSNENGRNHTIAGMANSQDREAPLELVEEGIVLASYTQNNQANTSPTPNFLDIRSAPERHSFEDGYQFIDVAIYQNIDSNLQGDEPIRIPIDIFRESNNFGNDRIYLGNFNGHVYLVFSSADSFVLTMNQNTNYYLKSITGIRLKIQ